LMRHDVEPIRLPPLDLAPANRARLARYLELPSATAMNDVTSDEVERLDERRRELMEIECRAAAVPVRAVDGGRIECGDDRPPIEATPQYAHRLAESGCDAIVIAAFTLGARIDDEITRHLDRDELFEAFVLKQWAATMAEQARVELTAAVRKWANGRRRKLLPYDGPGYNGWPLSGMLPLLELVYHSDAPAASPPIRVTEHGALLPTNSMLLVFGLARRGVVTAPRHDESLAQCQRCTMRNCRYRMADVPAAAAAALV
jgi:hypothetical protein